jgi:hypothetical protein
MFFRDTTQDFIIPKILLLFIMNVILTNYGHKYITELFRQHIMSRLLHNAETLQQHDEAQCFLLNLLTSILLPYHDQRASFRPRLAR